MTDSPSRPERVETCRWSLALGLALVVASGASAALTLTRLSGPPAAREVRASAGLPAPPPPGRGDEGELRPGLLAEVWTMSARAADFRDRVPPPRPARTRIDRKVDFGPQAVGAAPEPPVREGYLVRWTGLVRIPRDGRYRFFTRSGDGSRLWIDDQTVVEGTGAPGTGEAVGEAELHAGDHALRLEIFADAVDAGGSLLWESEGLAKDVVPEGALFHRSPAVGR